MKKLWMLFAMAAALVTTARAQQIKVTITGTLTGSVSTGTLFGVTSTPGHPATIPSTSFSLVYTLNLVGTDGTDSVSGGNYTLSEMTKMGQDAVLTAAGQPWDFGAPGTGLYDTTVRMDSNGSGNQDYEVVYYAPGNLGNALVSVKPASGTTWPTNGDWRVQMNTLSVAPQPGSNTWGIDTATVTANGNLTPSTLTVAGVGGGAATCSTPSGDTTTFSGLSTTAPNTSAGNWAQVYQSMGGVNVTYTNGPKEIEGPGTVTDSCYSTAHANHPGLTIPFLPVAGIAGGGDTFPMSGTTNQWGYDTVGYQDGINDGWYAVTFYRTYSTLPCTTTFYQQMEYKCSNGTYYPYGPVNTLQGVIDATTVTSNRAGSTSTPQAYTSQHTSQH